MLPNYLGKRLIKFVQLEEYLTTHQTAPTCCQNVYPVASQFLPTIANLLQGALRGNETLFSAYLKKPCRFERTTLMEHTQHFGNISLPLLLVVTLDSVFAWKGTVHWNVTYTHSLVTIATKITHIAIGTTNQIWTEAQQRNIWTIQALIQSTFVIFVFRGWERASRRKWNMFVLTTFTLHLPSHHH